MAVITLATNLVNAVPGTAVAFSATVVLALTVSVSSMNSNVGEVRVGGPNVLVSGKKGIPLSPGDSNFFAGKSQPYDLSKLYFDAANAGDGISITYDEWNAF